jgi:hypothetical protein
LINEKTDWHNFDSKGNLYNHDFQYFEVDRDSTFTKSLKIVQMVNVLYIAFMVPFSVGFEYPMNTVSITLESISLLVQFVYVVSKLRTPVLVNGRKTLQLKYVLRNYYYQGLIIDAFGLLPLNLILGIIYPHSELMNMRIVELVAVLRVLRVLCIWRWLELIEEIAVQILSETQYVVLFKAITIWFMIGHMMACWWAFFDFVQMRDVVSTWTRQ